MKLAMLRSNVNSIFDFIDFALSTHFSNFDCYRERTIAIKNLCNGDYLLSKVYTLMDLSKM